MPTENEKQLTAIMQLIQYNDELIAVHGDTMTAFDLHNKVMKRAVDLLATERQQLIDAHKDGATFVFKNSETYYNDTFKTQK